LNQRLKVQRTRFGVDEDVGFPEPFFSIAEEGHKYQNTDMSSELIEKLLELSNADVAVITAK
jgi:hypothetical protein